MTYHRPNDKELAQADYDYWLARVDYEMPKPDDRTLIMLGRAAWLLAQSNEPDHI